MLTIKQWMELVDYRITEGGEFGWRCYGPNAYRLDSWNGLQNDGGYSFGMVFDTQTQEVYEVEAADYTNNRAYRIINSNYREAYNREALEHNCADYAWDDVKFTDLEVDEDFVQKGRAIIEGKNYDTRVSLPLEFTNEELLKYMKIAHDRDITFNQFVEQALVAAIEQYQRDPEGMKARAEQWRETNDAT
jgi:hypothetical protein